MDFSTSSNGHEEHERPKESTHALFSKSPSRDEPETTFKKTKESFLFLDAKDAGVNRYESKHDMGRYKRLVQRSSYSPNISMNVCFNVTLAIS